MFGIVLTLIAVLLVIILAFCDSDNDSTARDNFAEAHLPGSERHSQKKSG